MYYYTHLATYSAFVSCHFSVQELKFDTIPCKLRLIYSSLKIKTLLLCLQQTPYLFQVLVESQFSKIIIFEINNQKFNNDTKKQNSHSNRFK